MNKDEKEGYKFYTLGDIIVYLPKSKRKAGDSCEGEYNFYSSSDIIKTINEADYNEPSIILGTGGKANVKFDNLFSCSSDNFILQTISEVEIKYLYYWFKSNLDKLDEQFQGATIKHISKERLNKIKIQIPPLEKQKEIINNCDKVIEETKNFNGQNKIIKSLLLNYINGITIPLTNYLNLMNQINNYNKQIEECDQNIEMSFKLIKDYKLYTLGDIIEIKYGKRIIKKNNSIEQTEEYKYPVYGGGDISFYTNEYNREGTTCKI